MADKDLITLGTLSRYDENIKDYIDDNSGSDVPVYTMAEYEAIKDTIPEGTQFIITDDYLGDGSKVLEDSADWLKSKNLFDGELVQYTWESDGSVFKDAEIYASTNKFIPVKGNTTYTASFECTVSNTKTVFVVYYDENKSFLERSSTSSNTFTTREDAKFVKLTFYSYSSAGVLSVPINSFSNIQVEEGDTATEYQPYNKSNDELTTLTEKYSNPNLLDNPFFTVNSRGKNSYVSSEVYCFDRWTMFVGTAHDMTVSKNTDGSVSIYTGSNEWAALSQYLDNTVEGKTVTFSYIDETGVIKSTTGVFPLTGEIEIYFNGEYNLKILLTHVSGKPTVCFTVIYAVQSTKTIKAVKLELGSVSTLANDVAPDLELETIKCQSSTADSTDTYANRSVTKELSSIVGGDSWTSRTYTAGETCIHNNKIWYCLADNNVEPTTSNSTYWKTISLAEMMSNFQGGVDSIYNAIVAKGSTPTSKSLSDVVASINELNISRELVLFENGQFTTSYFTGFTSKTSSSIVTQTINGTFEIKFPSGGRYGIYGVITIPNGYNYLRINFEKSNTSSGLVYLSIQSNTTTTFDDKSKTYSMCGWQPSAGSTDGYLYNTTFSIPLNFTATGTTYFGIARNSTSATNDVFISKIWLE